MGKYVCNLGLFHDKKVVDGNYSSNNGWIYTAYARAIGIKTNEVLLDSTFVNCKKDMNESYTFFMWRLPDKINPPISRDEIIGMVSLGYYPLGYEKIYGWSMYREIFHIGMRKNLKAMKELFRIRKEHRNYWWENNLYDALPITMKLWWHDRYYINKMHGNKCTMFQMVMFYAYALGVLSKADPGELNLLWLQLKDLKSWFWIRFINEKKRLPGGFWEGSYF